jgi:hypothetical protein
MVLILSFFYAAIVVYRFQGDRERARKNIQKMDG